MIKFLFTNLTKFVKHGKFSLNHFIYYSFNLFKEVEELRNVERKFAKALGIPIENGGSGE